MIPAGLVDLLDSRWNMRVFRVGPPEGERHFAVTIERRFCAPLTGRGDSTRTHDVTGYAADFDGAVRSAYERWQRQRAEDPRWGLSWEERHARGLPEGSTVEQARAALAVSA